MSAPAPKKIRLDPFQSRCIEAVDAGESVMCSAHTSAGKTVVALHAIAKSLAAGQRVVYTSPIKALSNQKYRELQQIFEDVGLMTGETSVDADASCLVMTTEILRNMLYKGHELVREVQWVIFDEVHYMRDKERGVIWEECIILLPHAVRFVFLSATVPNGVEFARWVAHLHGRRCHLVTTQYRPTPLQHWALPAGGEGLHLVLDESGTFHPASLAAAAEQLQRCRRRLLDRRLRVARVVPGRNVNGIRLRRHRRPSVHRAARLRALQGHEGNHDENHDVEVGDYEGDRLAAAHNVEDQSSRPWRPRDGAADE